MTLSPVMIRVLLNFLFEGDFTVCCTAIQQFRAIQLDQELVRAIDDRNRVRNYADLIQAITKAGKADDLETFIKEMIRKRKIGFRDLEVLASSATDPGDGWTDGPDEPESDDEDSRGEPVWLNNEEACGTEEPEVTEERMRRPSQ